VVIEAPPPARTGWRFGLYWIYAILLSLASVFWLAIASPIIRPTLPSHPEHLLFCIFAGIAIADAAAHAINDIAAIWKPHDLGGAQSRRQKFSVRKFLLADVKRLASHLSAVPIIGLVASSYTLLTPHIEDRLFGHSASEGAVFWNFISQSILGGIDLFAFFLSQEAKETVRNSLHLSELSPASFEAGAILAGLKLYGVLIIVSALRVIGAPVVIFRTWMASKSRARKKKPADI
jgi:hypothetical protein